MPKRKIKATKKNITNKLADKKDIILNQAKMEKGVKFIIKFILCEVACKHIVEAYKKQEKSLKPGQYITLDMRHIPAAMSMYEYSIPRHLLSEVFSGNKKRGTKSCKKLRDGILHALDENDLDEIISREDALHKSMDDFLKYF